MTRTSSTSWHHDGIDRRPAFIGVYFRSLQTTSLPMDAHKRTGRLLWWFFFRAGADGIRSALLSAGARWYLNLAGI